MFLFKFPGTGKTAKSDSHDRLFGETNRQLTPTKNHMKSSIPFGAAEKTNGTNGNGVAKTNGHSNGNGSSSSSNSSTNGDAVDMAPVQTPRKGERSECGSR